jgi:hypothetical protein
MVAEQLKPMEAISFEEAQAQFKEWLASNGPSSDLIWLFREDVLFLFDRVFVRTPIPDENESRMAACYQLGQARGFGLNLHGFSLLDSRLCCYVALPKDDLESQYMMMDPEVVKYSWRSDPPQACAVRNPLLWQVRSWQSNRARFEHFDRHIPSRSSLLPLYRGDRG